MTAFWLQDPTVLFNNAGITQIIPTADMTREAKLNAISRLIIVLSILGYLLTMSYNVLLLGVVSLGVIAILNNATEKSNEMVAQKKQQEQAKQEKQGMQSGKPGAQGAQGTKEGFANYNTGRRRTMAAEPAPSGLTFQAPTPQDPLMNVLLTEIKDRPKRPAAEPAFHPAVEDAINESAKQFVSDGNSELEDRLFHDLGDNYEFSNSMRSYFATPNTRIANDQNAFAQYCYGSMISCKEGNLMACGRANPVLGSITG
jgi:hypothetical protein